MAQLVKANRAENFPVLSGRLVCNKLKLPKHKIPDKLAEKKTVSNLATEATRFLHRDSGWGV